MTIELGSIPAGAPSRPSVASSGPSRADTAPAPAPSQASDSSGRWVAVMTPQTTAVVYALVSEHGEVEATVPAVLSERFKRALPNGG